MTNHPNRNKVKNWPEYLKSFRKKHELTQKKLADLLQISQRNIENWEMGISKPHAYLKKAMESLFKD